MLLVLAIITAVAALAAYHFPNSYMKPGVPRMIAQIAAVLLALFLGSMVAAWGPKTFAGLSFHQLVVIAILVLGLGIRLFLNKKS